MPSNDQPRPAEIPYCDGTYLCIGTTHLPSCAKQRNLDALTTPTPWLTDAEGADVIQAALRFAANKPAIGAEGSPAATIREVDGDPEFFNVTLSTGQRFQVTLVQVNPLG